MRKTEQNKWGQLNGKHYEMLTLLQAPPNLPGLLGVVLLAKYSFLILQKYPLLLPKEVYGYLPHWIRKLSSFEDLDTINAVMYLDHDNDIFDFSPVNQGLLTTYPVYAALCELDCTYSSGKPFDNRISLLASILIIFNFAQEKKFEKGLITKKTDAVYAASLDIRNLRKNGFFSYLEINKQTTFDELCDQLALLKDHQDCGVYYDGIERLVRLISEGHGGRNRSISKKYVALRYHTINDDSYDGSGKYPVTIVERKSTADPETHFNQELISSDKYSHRSAKDQAHIYSAISKRISKKNQYLQSKKNVTTDIDLYYLHREIELIGAGKSQYSVKSNMLSNTEFVVFSSVLLWLGRSCEETVSMLFCHSKRMNLSPESAYFIKDSNVFLVPDVAPKAVKLDRIQTAFLDNVDHAKHIELYNPIYSSVVTGWIADRTKNGHRIFLKPLDVYVSELRNFKLWMNNTHNTHLTTHGIEKTIYNKILSATKNSLVAYHLTGSGGYESQNAAHYLSTTAGCLSKVFFTVTQDIRFRLSQYSAQKYVAPVFSDNDGVCQNVGSKIVITTDIVRLVSGHLKSQIRAAKKLPISNDRVISLHNSLTIYTVMMFFFLTGARPVVDPLENINHILWEDNLLIICDKDNDGGNQTRRVPIASVLGKQLTAYIDYLPSLAAISPTMRDVVEQVISGDKTTPFLFLVSKKMRVRHFTPKAIAELLPEYPLPVNSHRHYLNTQLHYRGITGEYISYIFGHGRHGQEQDGKYSSLSPLAMYQSLLAALNDLAKQDGWVLVPGVIA